MNVDSADNKYAAQLREMHENALHENALHENAKQKCVVQDSVV